ncbi:hypothetical protein BGX29_005507 [Mortierella sp. GBA35]|nr:hypothetical protein BGX29_005507 [Mortierella sp. GBA35]
MDLATHAKVFDVPELATLIADELSQHDLSFCCRVSQQWFNAFTPHLWHPITVQYRDPVPKFQSSEGRAGLLRNGHHIRVLRVEQPYYLQPFLEYGTTCTNLICLDAQYGVTYPANTMAGGSLTNAMAGGSLANATGGWRSPALLSKGRRGSTGSGQKQVQYVHSQAWMLQSQFGVSTSTLTSVLERNPRLEFLVVPPSCMENEALVKVVAESLLRLKEFYSITHLQGLHVQFSLTANNPRVNGFGHTSSTSQAPAVEGRLHLTKATIPYSLFGKYPRLKELQPDFAARINRAELERIRTASTDLVCLRINGGVPRKINQILDAIPGLLTSIDIHWHWYFWSWHTPSIDNTVKTAFLKHAPTLEHLCVRDCDFDKETLLEILCSNPHLKTFETMEEEEYMGNRPNVEVEFSAAEVIDSPWVCGQLQVFECKIRGVPRPDITLTPYDPHQIPHVPQETPHAVQQESHALQRSVLKQLGRLANLRKLSLGAYGQDKDNREYSQLTIKHIRTMFVDEFVQCDCLELSLESGLEELAGLEQLEELAVHQMAHRIGLLEVRWMVEHWPKLRAIHGLRYTDSDEENRDDEEEEAEEPEHITWLRANRPDIQID